jgi:hypothetical protein
MFTVEEDRRLVALVEEHGTRDWRLIAQAMEGRNARQCRERWTNYVNPDLRVGHWMPEEDRLLEEKFAEYGTRWNTIAKFFFHRAPLKLRNRWMALKRRHHLTESGKRLTRVQRESPIPNPFSDEELRMLIEDIVF